MLFTSGYNFEGYDIVSYIGHESAQAVLGTGIFSSLNAAFSDLLGVRSNSYENKLAEAEQVAKERLIQKAHRRGGNAIIGIDVDYTTFTNDVIGIIVEGTIVKIEKKIPEKEVKQLPNMEFNMSLPFRILDCTITYKVASGEIYMSLHGKNYLEDKIKSFEVKIALETIFHDVIEIKNNVFADILIDENKEIFTEYNKLEIESNIFKTLKAASIQIVKYITDREEVLEVSAVQNVKINDTPEQLINIRALYGNDVIGKAYKKDSEWVCYCGKENRSSEQTCKYCGRKIDIEMLRPMKNGADSDIFDLDEHITVLNALKNAAEIYEYLVGLKYPDVYFSTVILPEMKKYKAQERIYGDMKDSALKKLKELWLAY